MWIDGNVSEIAWGFREGSSLSPLLLFTCLFSLLRNTVIKEGPYGNETQNTVLRYHKSSDFQYPIPQKILN